MGGPGHAVSGELTVTQALSQMIAGTGLEMSFESDFSFASIKPVTENGTGAQTASGTLASSAVATREVPRGLTGVPVQARRPGRGSQRRS